MREIKFRVWCEFTIDGEKHCEMAGPENWFLLTQTGHLMSHGPMSFNPNAEQQYDKLIVEFYTGLKDKNGRESFFGDLIKIHEQIFEIKWDKKMGRIFLYGYGIDEKDILYLDGSDIFNGEICGNIHE